MSHFGTDAPPAWGAGHLTPGWSSGRSAPALLARTRAERQLAVVAALVLLMPVNWALGTTLLAVFAAAAYVGLPVRRISAVEVLLALLALALFLGIVVGLARDLVPGQVIGSTFNVVLVTAMIAFVNFARHVQLSPALSADRIYRAAFWCFWAQVAVIAIARLAATATGAVELKVPSLLGIAGELPGILQLYSTLNLSVGDTGPTSDIGRAFGIGIYAGEGAILVMLVGLLASLHAVRKGRYLLAIAVELAIVVSLVEISSRTALLAYVLALPLLLVLLGRRLPWPVLVLAPLGMCGLALAVAYGPLILAEGVEKILGARAESSNTRFMSYMLGIRMTLESNPITGLGILPKDPMLLGVPIGSHSSWTSLFTRGGLLALSCWAFLHCVLIWIILRAQMLAYDTTRLLPSSRKAELVFLSRSVLIFVLWALTEDFDFPAHEVAMAGMTIGLLAGAVASAASAAPQKRFAPDLLQEKA